LSALDVANAFMADITALREAGAKRLPHPGAPRPTFTDPTVDEKITSYILRCLPLTAVFSISRAEAMRAANSSGRQLRTQRGPRVARAFLEAEAASAEVLAASERAAAARAAGRQRQGPRPRRRRRGTA
jgi:hypothetical protein